ncbi:MAG TPA: glycoside hydrolase domain-containing protein, partial [Candidatus Lokiarchaeia archaeon]|nr:glycoside hydrolase domain-containing protein [Candidatus Lokiarchaeia archaeon]
VKKWAVIQVHWIMRILVIIGFILGSLVLNAGLILALNNVNAAIVVAAIGCAGAMGLVFFKGDVLKGDFRKLKNLGDKPGLFTPDSIKNEDGTEFNRKFDFFANPRNVAWRLIRNFCNAVLTATCLFLIVTMCFIAVPDEWVFPRFFDLLPWIIVGLLIGTAAMAIIPEPAIYYPATIAYVIQTYNNFLGNFPLPFSSGFITLNGGILGFWIAVLISSQFHMFRAKTRERNFTLMLSLMLAFSLAWIALCVTSRFQSDGSSWNEPITSALDVVLPLILTVAQDFLYISIGFWGLDIAYRVYRKYKSPALLQTSSAVFPPVPLAAKHRIQLPTVRLNLSRQKKKVVSLLVIGIFLGSFTIVQVSCVYGNAVQPLLYRNDEFGIWAVDATTKIESDFSIQMPPFAPIESNIQVAAGRGEWNAFHVIISPQPGKTITLTNVDWGGFTQESGSDTINASIINVFLVSYLLDRQPDQLLELPPSITRFSGENLDLYFQLLVPRDATAGIYDATIHLTINALDCPVLLHLQVYNFTIPADNHLQTAFGGGWDTSQWYDELQYLRISQQDYRTIPFQDGQQYWWNSTIQAFQFNWTLYDAGFQAQLNRGFTGIRQGYFPDRPANITSDSEWAIIEASFLQNVTAHLESQTWVDHTGINHSWIEIPYYYWIDEPKMSQFQYIEDVDTRYHANGTSPLRTLLTLGFDANYGTLNTSINILCPVIGNFEPSLADSIHAKGQQYWFYTDVDPIAPYPNFQLQEPGNDPRLLPYICARFQADGFLYWSMTSGNDTYRAGFDGNGDGQLAFNDTRTGDLLPSLRLLSFSLGVEDYECIWLMRATIQEQNITGPIPANLLARAAAMETRLDSLVGARPQFVNHDPNALRSFKADLSQLLEDLWPYSAKIYAA